LSQRATRAALMRFPVLGYPRFGSPCRGSLKGEDLRLLEQVVAAEVVQRVELMLE
jgi:hypothetical protein